MGKSKYLKIKRVKKVERHKKNVSFFSFFLVFTLFLMVVFGVSYAFLFQTLKGKKENIVKAGMLAIEYKDKKVIYMENSYPMSDTRGMETNSYEFSVENTGDVKAIYDISLENDNTITNALNHAYIKYSIKKNDDEWSDPQVLSSLLLEKDVAIEMGGKNTYQLKLWIDEMAGNEAQDKVFKARIVVSSTQDIGQTNDVTAPTITLAGDLSISIEQNGEYSDVGVESVVDDKDTLNKEDIIVTYEYYDGETISKVDGIDISKLGVYYITYQIDDKSGNTGKVIRSVNIYKQNTTPPVIQLNGKSLIAIKKDEVYEDQGASATSGETDLTSKVVTVGEVNTKKIGTYDIKYLITDNDGNTASIVRIVNVIHINSDFKASVTLDLTDKPTDKIKIEGENLGDITYTSGDPDIVTVDENGNVTGQNPGTTTITIKTSTGHEETITITVTKTVTATFIKQGGVSSIGEESASCAITEKDGSCNITLPSITSLTGYHTGFWSTSITETSGTAGSSSVNISGNVTYYAKALDTTKPVWSLVNTNPTSGSAETVSITFKGTDTSGSVTSMLVASSITVKVGDTTVNPTTKTLSEAIDTTDGKQYTLTLSGLSSSGILSIIISASTLQDGSGNENDATTFTTGISILDNSLYNRIANSAVLDNVKSEFVTNETGIDFKDISSDTNGKGIYTLNTTKDDTYPVHYYRGAVTDNNVKFGGFCWKIVRTTETGGVKLVYNGSPDTNGKCANTTGETTQIGTSQFNQSYDKKYAGYMVNNTTNSSIKNLIDNWYQNNMVDYTTKLEDTIWCNERTESTDYGYFVGGARFKSSTPNLNCSNISYKFTVSKVNGNGLLTYPVALLTSDEIMLAGAKFGTTNSSYYLYTNQIYWNLTPYSYSKTNLWISAINVSGTGFSSYVYTKTIGVRPSVSLAPETKITSGDGSMNSPFVVE